MNLEIATGVKGLSGITSAATQNDASGSSCLGQLAPVVRPHLCRD